MYKSLMSRGIPEPTPVDKAVAAKNRAIAELVASLEDTEGWKAFVGLAEELARSMTPDVPAFDANMATHIASQMAFVSGIKRTIGLMDQQKRILQSNREQE